MPALAMLVLLCLAACKGGGTTAPVGGGSSAVDGSGSGSGVTTMSNRWVGTIAMPKGLVDIVVAFAERDGKWTATLDVPASKLTGLVLEDVAFEPAALRFTLVKPAQPPQANERYELVREGATAKGKMMIGGQEFPVRMEARATGDTGGLFARPQVPKPPLPYTTREVTIAAPEDGTLAGTLAIPSGTGPFPAVVLVSGSGQQDRDETIFGHKPFAVITDKLARAGIATLRFDDRHAGSTKGKLTSLETEFGDARAAFEWLGSQSEIDVKRTGLIGHSIGGTIVAVVAARTQKAAFVVALAGPGVRGAELVPMQLEISLAQKQTDPALQKAILASQRAVGAAIVGGKDAEIRAAVRSSIVELAKATGQGVPPDALIAPAIEQKLAEVKNPWVVDFFKIDPAESWRKISAPVLALTGDKDFQVPADVNLAKIGAAARAGGNRDVTTEKLAGLNHLFQHATTGMDDEYPLIDETFDPATLEKLVAWIRSKTAK